MNLVIDIGNTTVHVGYYSQRESSKTASATVTEKLPHKVDEFRTASTGQLVVETLRRELRSRAVPAQIAVCCVQFNLVQSVQTICREMYGIEPLVVEANRAWGINLQYEQPHKYGADRLAAAIGARALFPKTNLILVDIGTATTLCALDRDGNHLGGFIAPGPKLAADALAARSLVLPQTQIVCRPPILASSTLAAVQSGVFYQHHYFLTGVIAAIRKTYFADDVAVTVGTGGDSIAFESVFDYRKPDLVLTGLNAALNLIPPATFTEKETLCDAHS